MLAYVWVPKFLGCFVQLQVPHKFCCAPVPLLSEIGGTCPRQLYGAGAYATARLSRSVKVVGTNTERFVLYDFLLTFHSNQGTVSNCFRVKRRFHSKVAHFSNTRVFNAPAEEVAFGIW